MALARDLSLLTQYAKVLGYDMTLGDAFRSGNCASGHRHSLHRKRLAVDLNLFKHNKYLTKASDHALLGRFWESLGKDHSWGGHFGDGNHYSITLDGVNMR